VPPDDRSFAESAAVTAAPAIVPQLNLRRKQSMKKSSKFDFRCDAPDAAQVFLAGTFNGWNPSVTPM
jgi:1,4-alpha-glucan branching enzyme